MFAPENFCSLSYLHKCLMTSYVEAGQRHIDSWVEHLVQSVEGDFFRLSAKISQLDNSDDVKREHLHRIRTLREQSDFLARMALFRVISSDAPSYPCLIDKNGDRYTLPPHHLDPMLRITLVSAKMADPAEHELTQARNLIDGSDIGCFQPSKWGGLLASGHAIFFRPPLNVYTKPENTTCNVNFLTGCIDLVEFKKFRRFTKHDAQLVADAKPQINFPGSQRYAGRGSEEFGSSGYWFNASESIYRALKLFDGCPIILSDEVASRLLKAFGAEILQFDATERELEPHEVILDAFEQEPRPKLEIKAENFPAMSDNEFNLHWRIAAKVNPRLSKSGPR